MAHTPLIRRGAALGGAAAVLLGLAACGSTDLGSPAGTPDTGEPTSTEIPSVTADPALAAKVPDKVKNAGVIQVGTDGSYPPNEFIGTDGKTMEGMDVDLFDAGTSWAAAKGNPKGVDPADPAGLRRGDQRRAAAARQRRHLPGDPRQVGQPGRGRRQLPRQPVTTSGSAEAPSRPGRSAIRGGGSPSEPSACSSR